MGALGIRGRTFFFITLILTAIITLMSFIYYSRTSSIVLARSLDTSHQLLLRMNTAMDEEVKSLDRIATQVTYDSDIQRKFSELSKLDEHSSNYWETRKEIEDKLTDINAPDFSAKQIHLFDLNHTVISYAPASVYSYKYFHEFYKGNWVKETLAQAGGKLITIPHRSEWNPHPYFVYSLSRVLLRSGPEGPVLVEVQRTYDNLEKIASINQDPSSNVYMYDRKGRLMFPASMDQTFQLPEELRPLHIQDSTIVDTMTFDKVFSLYSSPYSNITIAIEHPKKTIFAQVDQLKLDTVLIAVSALILSLACSYFLAGTIIAPLKRLHLSIRSFNLDNPKIRYRIKESRNTPTEIKELQASFDDLKNRLNQSLEKIVESQRREYIAQIHAIQAQMNPHFLFNTLSSLASYAEELGENSFAEMCYNITSMMRYISLPISQPVSVKDEIIHTESFLQLVQLRYEERFQYQIDVDPACESIALPKLVIQPLVENSIKHGFQNISPPWFIHVTVSSLGEEKHGWKIVIQDNGSGFHSDTLAKLDNMISRLNHGEITNLEHLSNREIGGLGIINTFTRCKLQWKDQVRFQVQNSEQGSRLEIAIHL